MYIILYIGRAALTRYCFTISIYRMHTYIPIQIHVFRRGRAAYTAGRLSQVSLYFTILHCNNNILYSKKYLHNIISNINICIIHHIGIHDVCNICRLPFSTSEYVCKVHRVWKNLSKPDTIPTKMESRLYILFILFSIIYCFAVHAWNFLFIIPLKCYST